MDADNSLMDKRQNHVKIFVIFIIAIALRIIYMTYREFWYDEAFTGIIVGESWGKMFQLLKADVHPPLYYIFLKIWSYIAGANTIGLRSFSLIVNIINVWCILIFLKKHFSEKELPYIITFLIAINPSFLLYATEARMYALLSLFYFLAFYFFWQAIQSQNKYYPWVLFTIFYTLSLYTHYISFIGIVPFFIFVFMTKNRLSNAIKLFISFSISLLCYIPWFPILFQQMSANNNGLLWLPFPDFSAFIKTFSIMIIGAKPATSGVSQINDFYFLHWPIFMTYVLAAIFAAAAAYAMYAYKKYFSQIILFIFACAPIFFTFILVHLKHFSIYHDRYFFIFIPFFLIFVFSLFYLLNKKIFYTIAAGYMVMVLLIQIPHNTTYPQFAKILFAPKTQIKHIIVSDSHQFVMIKYYAPKNLKKSIQLYNKDDFARDFSSWIVLKNSDKIYSIPKPDGKTLVTSYDKNFLADAFPSLRIENINAIYYIRQ